MPCLEEIDNSEIASLHIAAQKSVIANLRSRLSELEAEARTTDISSPRLKQVQDAIRHLRGELNGEVETEPGSGKFRRDPKKKTAEERAEVMAQLYTQRKQYRFNDTTRSSGEPRTASLFGYPTIQEMIDRGYDDIAQEMMVRAASLLQARSDGRNPIDFLDTEGLEVKLALANIIEHHHIFNNVHVDGGGRVQFKTFKIYMNSVGELTMNVVPSYWNAAEHGRNTQFIGLMDGMHAGEDPVTHLHYYRFTEAEAEPIREKIRRDTAETIASAQARAERLQDQLGDLEFRRQSPEKYEQDLRDRIAQAGSELEQRKTAAKGLISKVKSSLSGEQAELREAFDAKNRELKQLNRRLEEQLAIQGINGRIRATEVRIADLLTTASRINLGKVPKAERDAKRAEKDAIAKEANRLKIELREQKKVLREKGDIDELIADTRRKLNEAELLAALTPERAVELFDRQNGFFSFDKGSAEKDAHATYRPVMNEELHRFYVRQTLEYLQAQHGDRAIAKLQELSEQQYRNNLLQRLGALVDKLPAA